MSNKNIKKVYQIVLRTYIKEKDDYIVREDRIYKTKEEARNYANTIILLDPDRDSISIVEKTAEITDDYISIY